MTKDSGISVVICTYDEPIEFFERCINSLLDQQTIKELIIMDSSKNSFMKDICDKKGGKIQYYYTPPRGVSEAKNEGVLHSNYDIVAFTDSDCIVDKNWAENLYTSFSDDVAIVGGKIFPKWLAKPNKIFLNSAIAQGFYSFFDRGDQLKEVEIIFGGGYAINKTLINGQIFSPNLRKKDNLICGEETTLCQRVRNDKLKVIYNPSVIIWHQIPKERIKFGWMWKRIYSGGISRVISGGRPTPRAVNMPYNFYDAMFLMIFIVPYLCGIFKGSFNILKQSFKEIR
jgi:glycosyltransferase involved in cell wall biosynthesis